MIRAGILFVKDEEYFLLHVHLPFLIPSEAIEHMGGLHFLLTLYSTAINATRMQELLL